MSMIEDDLYRPADYIINTPASLRRFKILTARAPRKYKPSRAMRAVIHLLASLNTGQLDLILPNHQKLSFEGKHKSPRATLYIHNERVIKRFLIGGRLGFCEAYLDGDWYAPDMAAFFELIIRNTDAIHKSLSGKSWYRIISRFAHLLKPNSRIGAKRNIYKHYDIGNDFYGRWLDPSMTYSSALFKDGITDLQEAQNRKYEEMCRRLDLKAGEHVLEIGCGWGGFAAYAAQNYGVRVTGVTISKAQYDYAGTRMEKAGLDDRVTIALCDYRDLSGTYDKISSIEMFEAVGESYWPAFFETLKARLKDGGRAVLQIITIRDEDFEEYRHTPDYIQRYIFPGGMLPSKTILEEQISLAGLRTGEALSFGPDYARTLAAWNASFQESWPDFKGAQFDTRFKRLWEQYLCYCQAGFATGTIDVIQLAVHKD